MAEVRQSRRLVESVDPETGQTIYRDEVTGELVAVNGTTEATEHIVPQGTYVTERTVVPGATTQESHVYSEDPYAYRRNRAYKVQQAIYLVFGILEGLLAIRFVLQLLGANPNSGFTAFIYGITAPFMAPFAGVFGQPALGGSVIEWNALVAIVAYALLAWVLAKVVWLVGGESRSGVRTSRVNTRIDQ